MAAAGGAATDNQVGKKRPASAVPDKAAKGGKAATPAKGGKAADAKKGAKPGKASAKPKPAAKKPVEHLNVEEPA